MLFYDGAHNTSLSLLLCTKGNWAKQSVLPLLLIQSLCSYMHTYTYIYIYICIDRKIKRKRQRAVGLQSHQIGCAALSTYGCITLIGSSSMHLDPHGLLVYSWVFMRVLVIWDRWMSIRFAQQQTRKSVGRTHCSELQNVPQISFFLCWIVVSSSPKVFFLCLYYILYIFCIFPFFPVFRELGGGSGFGFRWSAQLVEKSKNKNKKNEENPIKRNTEKTGKTQLERRKKLSQSGQK